MRNFNRLPNEHVISTLVRARVQMAFPSNSSFLNYVSLNCKYPKPFDLCSQVFCAAQHISGGANNLNDTLIDGTTWAIWKLSEPEDVLVTAIEQEWNANLRQAELAINREWQFCPRCIAEDKSKFGVSYWHTDHQFPGITHCLKHLNSLYKAPRMRAFEKLLLPQYINLNKAEQQPCSESLLDWSRFIYKSVEMLRTNSTSGKSLTRALSETLPFDSPKVNVIGQTYMKYMDRFEAEVSSEILEYLFNYYTRENAKRRLNLIRSVLHTEPNKTIQNPVYSLALIYWLKDTPKFLEMFDDARLAA